VTDLRPRIMSGPREYAFVSWADRHPAIVTNENEAVPGIVIVSAIVQPRTDREDRFKKEAAWGQRSVLSVP
jgi:hypothetical protein